MTKQTNFFQRVIAAVERGLSSDGVVVTESAMLVESTSGAQREVDVLIEGALNGHPVRIALECRDHASPQDVIWIDGLIGKYRDAKVSLIVAVSSSGFTKAASAKAEAVGIKAIHFQESAGGPIADLNILLVQVSSQLTGVEFRVEPAFASPSEWKDGYKTPLFDSNGVQVHTLHALTDGLVQSDMQQLVDQHGGEAANAIARGAPANPILIKQQYTGGGLFFQSSDGTRHEIVELTPEVRIEFHRITGSGKTYDYNRSRVFVATAPLKDDRTVGMSGILNSEFNVARICHIEVASTGSLLIRGQR